MFRKIVTPITCALLFACTSESDGLRDAGINGGPDASADASVGMDAAPGMDATTSALAESDKARVAFKRQVQLAADLALALELPANEICAEVGRYDCFGVHRIPLGGVEPYTLGINVPIEDTTVTTPLAVERIALNGCKNRVDRDLAGNPVIFHGLGADGAAIDPAAPVMREMIERLYRSFLKRNPSEVEVEHLRGFYGDVTAANEPRPSRAWAIMSCFAVATSVEMLFY